jgi:hypothetical protein
MKVEKAVSSWGAAQGFEQAEKDILAIFEHILVINPVGVDNFHAQVRETGFKEFDEQLILFRR